MNAMYVLCIIHYGDIEKAYGPLSLGEASTKFRELVEEYDIDYEFPEVEVPDEWGFAGDDEYSISYAKLCTL